MQSIDTMSVPQEGGGGVGGISLIKVGKDVRQVQNLGQAKFSLKETLFLDKGFMNFTLQKSQNFSTSDVIHQHR